MDIFVTGATGFVGSYLVPRLLERGHAVTCLVRDPARFRHLAALGARTVVGDLASTDALHSALSGQDCLIHLANIYSFWEPDPSIFERVNVEGTRSLFELALEAELTKVVHVSTCATYGRPNDCPFVEESEPGRVCFSHYARSKRAADDIAWALHRTRGLPLVVIHPAPILGAGDPQATGQLARLVVERRLPAVPCPHRKLTFVYVRDVAEIIARAAEHPSNVGQRYLAGKEQRSMREIVTWTAETAGVRPPRLTLPAGTAIAGAALLTGVARVTKRPPPFGLSLDEVATIRQEIRFDGSKAERELGISYTPVIAGVRDMVRAMRRPVDPAGAADAPGAAPAQAASPPRGSVKRAPQDPQREMMDRWNPEGIIFFGAVKALQLLRRAGVTSSEDAWRRMTRAFFRTEHSKHGIGVFNMRVLGDKPPADRMEATRRLVEALGEALRADRYLHRALRWNPVGVKVIPHHTVDLLEAGFQADGSIACVTLHPDPSSTPRLESHLRTAVEEAFITAYNATRAMPDKRRPRALLARGMREVNSVTAAAPSARDKEEARALLSRLLSSVLVNVETASPGTGFADSAARFSPPPLLARKHPGTGGLSVFFRLHPDLSAADVWFQASHIIMEGSPLAEMAARLREICGIAEELRIPAGWAQRGLSSRSVCSHDATGPIVMCHDFVDSAPLFETRDRLRAAGYEAVTGGITLPGLLLWGLGQQEAFKGRKMLLPVHMPATNGTDATLRITFIRPSRFDREPDRLQAFLSFQTELNHLVDECRRDQGVYCQMLDAFSIWPAPLHSATVRLLPAAIEVAAGTTGLTIMPWAETVIAPMSDVHIEGYVAVGNLLLPTEDGHTVGNVCVKARRERSTLLMEAVRRAVADIDRLTGAAEGS